jgi:DNA-binding MarR family transcriptional regulator
LIDTQADKVCKMAVNLSFAQVIVLLCIQNRPESCVNEIAAIRGISRSAVTQSIATLVENGLVVLSSNNQGDRRKKTPLLTPKAQSIVIKVLPELEKFVTSIDSTVSDTIHHFVKN